MRTFVLRARKGSFKASKREPKSGFSEHIEIIAHTLSNAFYVSKGIRQDVVVYLVLDSMPDFPRTLRFSSNDGLSFPGFHEQAFFDVIQAALLKSKSILKDDRMRVAAGVDVLGFGFDRLMKELQEDYPLFLLDKKGTDIRSTPLPDNGIFILSDHLPMPKNSIKGLRGEVNRLSLGRKMLFASQCIVLIHDELDRTEN